MQNVLNRLILGDNLKVLKTLDDESVDLIYLDPPFFSNRNYEVIWGDAGEIRSFQDRFAGGVEHYCDWLYERVEELHRVLKSTGSLYLHCDHHADAYIRVRVLDKLFGAGNFRNEIVWHYGNRATVNRRCFPRKHDSIFWYSKSDDYIYHEILKSYQDEKMSRYNKIDENGKAYALIKRVRTDGTIYYGKTYPRAGVPETDVWDISLFASTSKERIGYPTQKPEALLERIIKASSNPGDVVLDPFCGGGTALAVADRLGRRWIGIDQSVAAVAVTEARLTRGNSDLKKIRSTAGYKATGEKLLFEDLQTSFFVQKQKYDYDEIRSSDAFEFEAFIVGQIGGSPNAKQRGDKGIDGKLRDGTPVQVKRSDLAGRNVIDNFVSAIRRYNKTLFEQCVKERKVCGTLVAFSFGRGLIEEVGRLNNEENIVIDLKRVDEIIPMAEKPKVKIVVEKSEKVEKGWRASFSCRCSAHIEVFFWDFDYDENEGFRPSVLKDQEGRQTCVFSEGEHIIAVKATDENGIETFDAMKFVAGT